MKDYRTSLLILILTPFVFSFAFGLDIYIPIVPEMIKVFNTTPSLIQLTLGLFLFTTGVGQLFIGPLSDQFGRKRIFYLSSLLYIVGGVISAFSLTISHLLIGRFISSLGACGMLVTSFAVVRDLFSGNKSAKMFSFLNGTTGISPTFAPIIGGYLALSFGWQSIFIFLAAFGVGALLIAKIFIKETLLEVERVPVTRVFRSYKTLFTHKDFLIFSVIGGLGEAIFFCFFSLSPFILIEHLKVSVQSFGFYFAIFGIVIGAGGFLSARLIDKIGISRTMMLGMALALFAGFLMLVWYYYTGVTVWNFLLPMALSCLGGMCLCGGAAASALEPFKKIAGTASAGFGAIQFGLSSIIGSILMLFPRTTTIPYAFSIILVTSLAFLFFQLKTRQAIATRDFD